VSMSAKEPETGNELPTAFRGYDREATDKLLRQVEERYNAATAEQGELRSRAERAEQRVHELEDELAAHRERTKAVGEALITAEKVKTESEREAAELRDRAQLEASVIREDAERQAAEARAQAERDAEAIVREAESRRESLVQEVQRSLEARQHEAEHLLDDTRERLSTLVRDLLARVTGGVGEDALSHGSEHELASDSPVDGDGFQAD